LGRNADQSAAQAGGHRRAGELANQRHLLLVVDNTFASPYLQQPLTLGAHAVVHSTTKYLGGHSDVVGGAFITSDQAVYETVKYYQNAAGAVPGPWDSWLVLRGLKTLKVRMCEQTSSALHLAQVLEKHPSVIVFIIPACQAIRNMNWQKARCAVSAA